jgi:hypothetical protein
MNALIEDDLGKTQVVPHNELTPGVAKSTPGVSGSFDKSNQKGLYAGQWVMAPSRGFIFKRYSSDMELAVLYEILEDGKVEFFYCYDGRGYIKKADEMEPYGPNFQLLFSAKPAFKQFKQAAIRGDREDTTRFELGSKFPLMCVMDYSESHNVLGDEEPLKDDPKTKVVVTKGDYTKTEGTTKVGNEVKKQVDAQTELEKKGVFTGPLKQGQDEPKYQEQDVDEGGGDGMVLGIIALTALIFIGFGGAAAAIPAI